jgi:hypothetical protein
MSKRFKLTYEEAVATLDEAFHARPDKTKGGRYDAGTPRRFAAFLRHSVFTTGSPGQHGVWWTRNYGAELPAAVLELEPEA